MTKIPPAMNSINSWRITIATKPIRPPSGNDPVSPMKTRAGWQLYQRNPRHEPRIAPHITTNSPLLGT